MKTNEIKKREKGDFDLETVKVYCIDKREMDDEKAQAQLARLPRLSYAGIIREARLAMSKQSAAQTRTLDTALQKTPLEQKILNAFYRMATSNDISPRERKFVAELGGFDVRLFDEYVSEHSDKANALRRKRDKPHSG